MLRNMRADLFTGMSKRFIDTSKYRQAWRKLDPRFRAAYSWLVENADAAGFWIIDLDHFKFECGYALDLEKFLREIAGAVVKHGTEKLSITDFIQVNYGELKEGYNPHKPALRALAASQLSSLNQASLKLEEEDKEEGEDNIEGKERARTDERFEALWLKYERFGSKGKALGYWQQLPEPDRLAIEAKVMAYVASTPGCEYRLNMEGWLNPKERRWEKPIVQRTSTKGPAPLPIGARDINLNWDKT